MDSLSVPSAPQFGGYPVQRPITQGRFDVRKIHGWDADRSHV